MELIGIEKKELNSVFTAFHVPDCVELRKYQIDAMEAWLKHGCSGIFAMATGAGKSYTALACADKLAQRYGQRLALFIVCPYIHLVGQWEEDVVDWAPAPVIAHSKSPDKNWRESLIKAYKRFRNYGIPFVCITTNDTFAGSDIQSVVKRFAPEQNVMLVIDEAHNFGSKRLSECLPLNISGRLALSATIERHMDKAGTQKLYEYFGEVCADFSLKDAIENDVLVKYDYHPIPVYLNEDELEEYKALTKQLARYLVSEDGKTVISEAGRQILFRRSRLLAGASAKIPKLLSLLKDYKSSGNILVYCGAASVEDEDTGDIVRMIDKTTGLIESRLGMRAHRFTAEEGLEERRLIKKYFQEGIYQVLTAIKCLDEGVNIPGIETAFIMASSRNPKEFIQRRGRLLRKSPGKEKAVIYDFVTLPRRLEDALPSDYESDRAVIIGELARIQEFGSLSDNPLEAEKIKMAIMNAYQAFIDINEEVLKMEEQYGD